MLLFSLNNTSWRSFHISIRELPVHIESHCMKVGGVLPQNVTLCGCTIFYLMTAVPYWWILGCIRHFIQTYFCGINFQQLHLYLWWILPKMSHHWCTISHSPPMYGVICFTTTSPTKCIIKYFFHFSVGLLAFLWFLESCYIITMLTTCNMNVKLWMISLVKIFSQFVILFLC